MKKQKFVSLVQMTGKKEEIPTSELSAAGSFVWDCISLTKSEAQRETLRRVHALVCAAVYGTVRTTYKKV